MISLHGPLHWSSKHQKVTARSSSEEEIYATDKCVRDIQFLAQSVEDLNLHKSLLAHPVKLFNNNMACVLLAPNKTTKILRHLQINYENAVCESIKNQEISIHHTPGATNISDIFTKEDKNPDHFLTLCNILLPPVFSP